MTEQPALLPNTLRAHDPLDALLAKHGYGALTEQQKAKLKRDFPAARLRDLEDFSTYWMAKRRRPKFDTYLRLRQWLRIAENGHRRQKRREADEEPDDIMARYSGGGGK